MRKIILYLAIVMLSLNACQNASQNKAIPIEKIADVQNLNPDEVVKLYFKSWNDKQYDVMYSLISDGFKQIEPTAKTFGEFQSYMGKFYETSTGVEIIEVKETYQNDKEAGVDYKINVVGKNGKKNEFGSTYTLKKRTNGWKLIHPYGKNIDNT